ncbi:MAG: hypothetical protein EXQ52_04195 [Bryobacterales bacterium]|nr:hypothetical protein [Bryobacterales bacterium]
MTNRRRLMTARSLPVIRHDSGFAPLRTLVAVLCLMPQMAHAAPVFSAAFYTSSLRATLGWSSDLGPYEVDQTGGFYATGAPVTVTAQAIRAGRPISATITQTAPYLLGGEYWASSWTGSLSIPGPGVYGLGASADASGAWIFDIPGLTQNQINATTFYFAALWDIHSPSDIHPSFYVAMHSPVPLFHGTATGSFTPGNNHSFGLPDFPSNPQFGAGTQSFDSNSPGLMDFSYQIAFSTTPIETSVFNSAPEPATWLMLAAPLAGIIAWRASRRRRTA